MISEIEYKPYKELEYSSLILNLKINNILVNVIRRTILNDVPTYAIPRELIKIETDTTIFNRDQLTLRLTQLPLLNLDTELSYLEPEYYEKKYDDLTRKVHPKEKDIKFYVHGKNTDILKKNITTNDMTCYINGKKIETKYSKNYPIILTVLRKDQEIDLNMKAVIGIGLKDVKWCPVSKCYFTYDNDPNDCKLYIYSRGQLSEYDIIRKALENIIYKLQNNKLLIHNFINDFLEKQNNIKNNKENNDINEIKITFDNLTIGNILNYFLQNDNNLLSSGIFKKTYLLDEANLIIKYDNKANILKEIDNNMNKAIELFTTLLNQLNKLKH